ncbi:hypothetical protein [Microcoleus sp. BROC3]|uniref:hypothetical protein n=1 Tax=Microcoleus sp. BROC3 TaxID=3055323 RepID=UPI002FD23C4C
MIFRWHTSDFYVNFNLLLYQFKGETAYAEAYNFNWFLWEVGLQFKEGYNGISGNQPINSSHPIFAGVKSLYQRNGSSIIDFQPSEQANQILVSSPDG